MCFYTVCNAFLVASVLLYKYFILSVIRAFKNYYKLNTLKITTTINVIIVIIIITTVIVVYIFLQSLYFKVRRKGTEARQSVGCVHHYILS